MDSRSYPHLLPAKVIKECAEKYGTPLVIVDHNVIRASYKEFAAQFPGIPIFYAMKCFSDIEALRTLYKMGCGFYVSSLYEIAILEQMLKDLPEDERATFMKNKVYYTNPVKEIDSIKVAAKYGITTAYDCEEELVKLKKYYPGAPLYLRVKAVSLHANVNCQTKYGCSPDDAFKLIKLAVDQGFIVEGLTFTVGSQNENPNNWTDSIRLMRSIYDQAKDNGIIMPKLNLSGGFPIQGVNTPTAPPLKEVADVILPLLKELFPETQTIAEPGRFLIAQCCTIVAEVFGKKTFNGVKYIFVNEGMFGCFGKGLVPSEPTRPLKPLERTGPLQRTVVCGRMPDTADIMYERMLPELEVGDLLYADECGAYTHCYSCRYGGFPPTPIHHINAQITAFHCLLTRICIQLYYINVSMNTSRLSILQSPCCLHKGFVLYNL
eukprot:TRINITY_DN121863_c1_g1_i1.p1 TRINITY_DN121863_c1_g1~~TRINITY_DN121863_c1_g1_i1.p1  ORF type:complete len:435 (+),score=8.19 TRINITY_DN121863_c1_g1_i1:289-1593(+)